jgi:type II secretory pathway predicted ATPase ExeA
LIEQIQGAISAGRLIAVCGAIGSGKTVLLQRLRQILKGSPQERDFLARQGAPPSSLSSP